MNKQRLNELYNQGYKPIVYITPNKKYDKMILKTRLQKENSVYEVYYNHVKSLLNQDQIKFIDCYNKIKLLTFRDKMELHVKSVQNKIDLKKNQGLFCEWITKKGKEIKSWVKMPIGRKKKLD